MQIASDAPVPAIELLRTQSLSALARREIERLIISGELRAGERVNENSLAARLGVSRGPIREACRALAQAGLVDLQVNRGVFVRRLELKEVCELYDVRASLVELAGRSLSPKVTPHLLDELASLVDQMADAVRSGETEVYYSLNLQFHDRLMSECGNGRLHGIYATLVKELSLFRESGLRQPGALAASNAEHRAIVDALRSGDPEAAAQAMGRHVHNAKGRMLQAVAGDAAADPGPGDVGKRPSSQRQTNDEEARGDMKLADGSSPV